jgi:hypothetical protein
VSSFQGLAGTIGRRGLFCPLYSDRGSHYFHTPKAGEKGGKNSLTQIGRALAQLGVEHIQAYWPQARGLTERAFRTLQDQLPKGPALAGIMEDAEAANCCIRDVSLPARRTTGFGKCRRLNFGL